MNKIKFFFLFFCLFSFSGYLFADVSLPQVISDNMMFQRSKEIKVWGWADRFEEISISFNGKSKTTRAGLDKKWMLVFPEMDAGGPYEMKIKAKNEIVLENILIGDIWICSGQSNMELNVANSNNSNIEIASANYPMIRLLTIPNNMKMQKDEDVPETIWKECNSDVVGSFSAVGYFFGRDIYQETGVPIGLISSNWGGTNIEAWTSEDYLRGIDDFDLKLQQLLTKDETEDEKNVSAVVRRLQKEFNIEKNKDNSGQEDWSGISVDYTYWKTTKLPGLWEKDDLPGIDGTVWFRKEFDIPIEVAKRGLTINLGKIDDGDVTWVNGVKIGETISQYSKERSYFADPSVLHEGINVIAVKVKDTGGEGGFWSLPLDMYIGTAGFRQSLSGNWKYRLSSDFKFIFKKEEPNEFPSSLFKGMIYPLLNFNVKGAIWYQGESNADRAYQYRKLFPVLIKSWRSKWKQPEMPFLFVQLANWREVQDNPQDSYWAELREAQLLTMQNVKNTGMAVCIDIGDAVSIHPTNKRDVGYRLAVNALKIAYGKDIVCQGPVYKNVLFSDDLAYVEFTDIGSGLHCNDKYGYLKGFAIAGDDKIFYWAQARVENDKIIVFSTKVKKPVAVRYAWADNPDDANLYNKEGFPATPFRTDDWKGLSEGIY